MSAIYQVLYIGDAPLAVAQSNVLMDGYVEVDEETWKAASGIVEQPSVQPGAAMFTYKTDIWRRCTEEEAAILDDALFNAPPRLRRLWDDCTRLEHDAPEWQTLLDQASVAFTPQRAAIIFAPSEG